MKYIAVVIATLLFSFNSSATNELIIDNSPLTVVLSDGNQAKLSSCSDFVALHNSGESIKELPDLSDPDYRYAKDALFGCWLSATVIKNGLLKSNSKKPDLVSVLKHFPAKAAYTISDELVQKVQTEYANKSIQDYTPDLKVTGGRALSTTQSTGYFIDNYYSFVAKDNKKLNILVLVEYALEGTAGNKSFWRIDDTSGDIWKITKLDENSPL
ncbi:hypothetical protein [Citrobacter braakii]|uniref:hypothetical protein n=1 Tax=Citrobacter braakii TaxID=57706 RepID=UPI00226E123A|nr:hypothetical protein [Citrobacter braakii]WAD31996.1 hypothetical protein MKJ05_04925 [Citrobacter braakii]